MFSADILYQRDNFQLHVDISLNKASICVLLGASGSGKSTLFRLLAGLEQAQQGVIKSGHLHWLDTNNRISVATQKRKLGMMFQDYALFEHMSVYDNIGYGVHKSEREQIVNSWLERIKLKHKADVLPCNLSGGEKQRVALARALACDPEVLLLDEPFSALDSSIRHSLRRELQQLIRQTQVPVLIATHDLEEARLIADYIYVMSEGKIVRHGMVDEVFNHPGSVHAATALGWHNILKVSNVNDVQIMGGWGVLPVRTKPEANLRAIAIPENAVDFSSNDQGISVTVLNVVVMSDQLMVEAATQDATPIMFRLHKQVEIPEIGETLSLYFDMEKIEFLY